MSDSTARTERALFERAEALAKRWNLMLGPRFPLTPGSPGNFVAPAQRADGTRCVLKVSPHGPEKLSEIAALEAFHGVGSARLLDADSELGGLLLERIEPGTMLVEVDNDDDATRIAASVLRQLWRAPETTGLIPLETWFAAYERNRAELSRGRPGFPSDLFNRADALRAELLTSTHDPVVLHGDLHHFNVLRSDRSGWLSIDPKGLFGDRYFDFCQFLKNPGPVPPAVNRRRLEVFCTDLDLDPERARQWCLVHAVLDACWSFEDGNDWRPQLAFAEQALEF